MTAWRSTNDLPETHPDGFEEVSVPVLIRWENRPFTAILVGANSEFEDCAYWRLLGRDGYRVEQHEVREWCEVPA